MVAAALDPKAGKPLARNSLTRPFPARQSLAHSLAHFPPSRQELRSRYRPLEPAACQPLWEKAFEAADATDPKERPGAVARKRRLHILGGAVMRCWGTVQVRGWGR